MDAKVDMGAEHIHMEDRAVGSYQLARQLWSCVVPDLKILEGWEGIDGRYYIRSTCACS